MSRRVRLASRLVPVAALAAAVGLGLGLGLGVAARAEAAGPDAGATAPQIETASVAGAQDPEQAARADAERRRLEALAKEYEKVETPGLDGRPERTTAAEGRSFVATLVKMFFVLGGVVLLAYLVLGRLLPRFFGVEPQLAERRIMRVIDRMPLDQRRSIMVIRIGSNDFLVGASDGGIQLLSRLDPTDVDEALATARATERPTLGGLAARLAKKRG